VWHTIRWLALGMYVVLFSHPKHTHASAAIFTVAATVSTGLTELDQQWSGNAMSIVANSHYTALLRQWPDGCSVHRPRWLLGGLHTGTLSRGVRSKWWRRCFYVPYLPSFHSPSFSPSSPLRLSDPFGPFPFLPGFPFPPVPSP